jgi:hypothetical protein
MEYFFFWCVFSIAVSLFASVRRNRHAFGWFILAIIISPLLAGIFLAILKELPAKNIQPIAPPLSASFKGAAIFLLVMIAVFLCMITYAGITRAEKTSSQSISRSTP